MSRRQNQEGPSKEKTGKPVGWDEAAVLPAVDENLKPLHQPSLRTSSASVAKPCGNNCCGMVLDLPEKVYWETVVQYCTV